MHAGLGRERASLLPIAARYTPLQRLGRDRQAEQFNRTRLLSGAKRQAVLEVWRALRIRLVSIMFESIKLPK